MINGYLMTHQQAIQTLKPRWNMIRKLKDEWDVDANASPHPKQLRRFPDTLITWRCHQHPHHTWKQTLAERIHSQKFLQCPICAKDLHNVQETVIQTLAPYWHETLNTTLQLTSAKKHSLQLAWWHCPQHPDTPFQSPIRNMYAAILKQKTCCPLCPGKRGYGKHHQRGRSIADAAPHLIDEWHPRYNGRRQLTDFTSGSGYKAWWRCSKGHHWKASIANRVGQSREKGSNCPFCRNPHHSAAPVTRRAKVKLATLHPALRTQWHAEKNAPLQFDNVTMGMGRNLWWRCIADPTHLYTMSVCNILQRGPSECPHCKDSRQPLQTLARVAPQLVAEICPDQPGYDEIPNIASSNNDRRVWWQCPHYPHHQYLLGIKSRVHHKLNCPHCANLTQDPSLEQRSILHTYPTLAREWDYAANRGRSPETTLPTCPQELSWRCIRNPTHTWQDIVFFRIVHHRGCPHCATELTRIDALNATDKGDHTLLI